MYQVTWLIETDPFVLLQLRGLPRDELLASLHELGGGIEADDRADPILETAVDAALRAARILELVDDPERPIDHLF